MLSSTPMISTVNSSMRIPSNTVRPTPFMPGRTWSSGRISAAAVGRGMAARTAVSANDKARYIATIIQDAARSVNVCPESPQTA
jgi:hypothetical protein